MSKAWQFLFFFLLTNPAMAKLAPMIDEHHEQCAMIISVKESSNQNYDVLVVDDEQFAEDLKLIQKDKLENSFYKLVSAQGDEAIAIHNFDGDNVLYHLMKAHDYFTELASHSPANTPIDKKVVVRLDMNKVFDPQSHFSSQNQFNRPQFVAEDKTRNWSEEIWFRSRKQGLDDFDWYDTSETTGQAIYEKDWLTLGVVPPLQLITHYSSGIDAAKIPDIIYREAFFAATDTESLFPSEKKNPIENNYANYFASSINGRKSIAAFNEFASDHYSLNFEKITEITNPTPIVEKLETFLPALFWEIRDLIGKEHSDQLIWNSMLEMHGSDHYAEIPRAVSMAAHSYRSLSDDAVKSIDALLDQYQDSFANLEEKYYPSGKLIAINKSNDAAAISVANADAPSTVNAASNSEAPKPGLFHKIFHAAAKGLEKIGFCGTILNSILEVPVDFGADFLSSLVLGKGVISNADKSLPHQLVAATGGILSYEELINMAGKAAFHAADISSDVGTGMSIINTLVCSDAEPSAPDLRNQYCATTASITKSFKAASAGLGERVGSDIRTAVSEFIHFLKNLL